MEDSFMVLIMIGVFALGYLTVARLDRFLGDDSSGVRRHLHGRIIRRG